MKPNNPIETREQITVNGAIEIRANDESGSGNIIGYGAVFNSLSENLGGFAEEIMPGAFAEAIQRDDVRALINHLPSMILGRNQAGTLALSETNSGLRYEITPPNTTYAADLVESIKRGDIDQSSFGFSVESRDDEEWAAPGDWNAPPGYENLYLRRVHRAKLYDVSPVTFAAYPATTVSARALTVYSELVAGVQAGAAPGEGVAVKRFLLRRKLYHNYVKRFGRINHGNKNY